MIAVEGILRLAACATAVISSLQAASRAKYLLEHNEIGIKEGPLIEPPIGNETSPLWDLVQVFQRSVQLGLMHHLDGDRYGFVVQPSSELLDIPTEQHDYKMEPYSLSPFPKPSSSKEDELLDQLVDMYIDQEDQSDDDSESQMLQHIKRLGGKLWPSSSISKIQQTTKYWTARAWYWRKSFEEFEEEFIDDTEDGTCCWHGFYIAGHSDILQNLCSFSTFVSTVSYYFRNASCLLHIEENSSGGHGWSHNTASGPNNSLCPGILCQAEITLQNIRISLSAIHIRLWSLRLLSEQLERSSSCG